MAMPLRTPALQVRDARAVSDRRDLEALKTFFASTLPPDDGSASHDLTGSLGKAKGTKRVSTRKSLFSMRRRRSSEGNESVTGPEKPKPTVIPDGSVSRKLGDHTVIMIGSRVPPKPIRPHRGNTSSLTQSTSSPVPSQRTPKGCYTSPIFSLETGTSPSVLPPHVALPHLSPKKSRITQLPPPPRDAQQSPSLRDREERSTPNRERSDLQIRTKSSRPALLPSLSATGGAIYSVKQARPPIVSFASEGEIFVTAHNSPVMEPPPIYVQSPFISPNEPTVPTSPFGQDRREVSYFSMDSEDVSSNPTTPISPVSKVTHSIGTQTESPSGHVPVRSDMGWEKYPTRNPLAKSYSTSSIPSAKPPPRYALPFSPGSSSSSLPSLQPDASSTSLQSSASKKRPKKKKSVPLLHPSPMPDLDSQTDYLEIRDLEDMEDKASAFEQLASIYKQQKFLRDAEHDLHRQRIADLMAGLLAQRMTNTRLIEALLAKGASTQEVLDLVGPSLDGSPLVPVTSADTLVSEDPLTLDASRFAMLGKDEQFGKMRDFGSSPNNLLSPLIRRSMTPISREATMDLEDATSDQVLAERALFSSFTAPILPPPSMPLPPMPTSRRTIKSMMISKHSPVILHTPRSLSLTEVVFPTAPCLEADIDEKMKNLESEFAASRDITSSTSTLSLASNPKTADSVFPSQNVTGANTPFELIIEEVVDVELACEPAVITSQASSDDGYQTGLNIVTMPSLGSSFATMESRISIAETIDLSMDQDDGDSDQSPFALDSVPSSHALRDRHSSSTSFNFPVPPNDHRRPAHTRGNVTPHTVYVESGAVARPVGMSLDESTWEELLMGLMRRADVARTRPCSEIDLEKGLTSGDVYRYKDAQA